MASLTTTKPWIVLLGLSLASTPLALHAQSSTAPATTGITHTQVSGLGEEASDQELAEHWKLSREEVARYRHFMRVEGRYVYAHLDPVMVLGLTTTDPVQRTRYAGQYLDAERARIQAQTRFALLVAEVQAKRFGLEKLVDFSVLPQVAQSSSYLAARATRGQPAQTPPSAASSTPTQRPAAPATLQAGDQVDFLIEPSCIAVCIDALKKVLQVPDVRVRLYGRGFKDTAALVAWLEQKPLMELDAATRARIAPRRFDPMIFSGIALSRVPVILLRRNGVVVGVL